MLGVAGFAAAVDYFIAASSSAIHSFIAMAKYYIIANCLVCNSCMELLARVLICMNVAYGDVNLGWIFRQGR
jgi:hypothetical protein